MSKRNMIVFPADQEMETVVTRLLAADSTSDVYGVAVDALDRLTDADQCSVAVERNGEMISVATASTGLLDLPTELPVSDEKGIIRHAYRADKSCVVDDLTDTRSVDTAFDPDESVSYRSLLCVPVSDRGILVAASRSPATFSETGRESVEQLASFVETALDRLHTSSADAQEREMAEEVATILSHDVSNAIMVANSYLDLAHREADVDHLDKVGASIDRLEDIVEKSVAMLRTGERETNIRDVELWDVAERAWEMVDEPASECDVAENAVLEADETALFQLIENLFRNAVEHGGPDVTVRVGTTDTGDGFYIEDDGEGIPSDAQDDVFDYGYSTAPDQTGLGLNIVQWVVEAHGWTIDVSSGEAGGTRFEITNVSLHPETPKRGRGNIQGSRDL